MNWLEIVSMVETLNIVRKRPDQHPAGDCDAPDRGNHHSALFTEDALCFPHPMPLELRRAAGPTQLRIVELRDSLSELAERQIAALGRLLPALLCGEESSFHVFWREARRLTDVQFRQSLSLARRIAAEELEHEQLLRELRNGCPVADDLVTIRLRARRFFLRMASRDPALHFARVAALDSGVCVILAAIAKPLARACVVVGSFNRIRGDEARHVRFSRRHSCELGADPSLFANTAVRIRGELVELLHPLASSFEDLGLDADHLFRRLRADKCDIQ
jgi:hypothetical protein